MSYKQINYKRIKITISTDNDAFGSNIYTRSNETVSILRRLIERLEGQGLTECVLFDSNGNSVGQVELIDCRTRRAVDPLEELIDSAQDKAAAENPPCIGDARE